MQEELHKIAEEIEKELRDRFENVRSVNYNPNIKGQNYEKILKEFLEPYLPGIYDFHLRAAILDADLEASKKFKTGENEFDVVATYKISKPRLVFQLENFTFVPYDAVAFLIEVKQTLTKDAITKDLEKLRKLNSLKLTDRRFGPSIGGSVTTKSILKILFYYEKEISSETLAEELGKEDSWDIAVILKDNRLLARISSFPMLKKADTEIGIHSGYPLFFMLNLIAATQPVPLMVNASKLFGKIILAIQNG